MTRNDYYEMHESRESLMESFPDEFNVCRDYARHRYNSLIGVETAKCATCRLRFTIDGLNEDGLCELCAEFIKGCKEGRIA